MCCNITAYGNIVSGFFSKTQSLYKRFDGAVAPKDRNKKMKKKSEQGYVRCALKKDVLGMWAGENESAKYWATVLNGLKTRRGGHFHCLHG